MIKLPHIVNAVREQPWLITPGGWRAVNDILTSKLAQVANAEDFLRPMAGLRDTEGNEVYEYQLLGNVAVIPIKGTIIKGASQLEKICGACSTEDIGDDLDRALGDPRVESIIFDIDSPGGYIQGVPELAARIAASRSKKGLYAYTDGQMCSAAYYLAAGCHGIFCTQTAIIGSIGVVAAFVDESQAYADAGFKVILFTGGEFKGEGYPGTSLSDKMKGMIQASVGSTYADFCAHVSTNRRPVKNETMQGQTFYGTEAAANSLVDDIVADIHVVFKMAASGKR